MLKQNHDNYFQIQTQLHVTKRTQCNFFMFTENWFYNIKIKYNDNFWNKNIHPRLNMLVFYLYLNN